ncbi:hypothetical protein PG996_007841 [Apiospora saccharicola]|uniref:Glycosyltransferase family 15 protein n=1 Tax=Apiospora saccharicola TaxID=335842 RepID=A0ABR1UW69_9PEZI
MPRSNDGHVARSPSQGSLFNSNEFLLTGAKTYNDEAPLLTGASSAPNVQGALVGDSSGPNGHRTLVGASSAPNGHRTLVGASSAPNLQRTPSPSRPLVFRKSLVTIAGLLLLVLILSLCFRDDSLLPGAASPVINLDDEATLFMLPAPKLPNGYHNVHKNIDPLKWLHDYSQVDPTKLPIKQLSYLHASRPKAALISLVNNSDVVAIVHTISQVEASFNSRKLHRYDWVFFSNKDFSEEFKAAVLNVSSSRCFFEVIPEDHWAVPHWIDDVKLSDAREFLEGVGAEKTWSESHHHKSRWNAGLFALESRLQDYKWYWRIEPGVQYTCNIKYDVFRFMRDNNMAYGFNMALLDDARSFPSLWDRTKAFQLSHPNMVHPEADMRWALHTPRDSRDIIRSASTPAGREIMTEAEEYNNCQFYSNFEIGSLDFFRGREHQSYFEHLDRSGGFYYERFGDAPMHTLSVNMFLPKRRVWYFHDIGYPHAFCPDCPPAVEKLTYGPEQDPKKIRAAELDASLRRRRKELDGYRKHFEKEREAPSLYCGHTIGGLDHDNSRLVPYNAKQRKPFHTCIRLWLGGKWLLKKRGWSREEETALGGDGYGGYLIDALEANPLQSDEPVLRIAKEWRSPTDKVESAFATRLYAWLYFVMMIIIVATMA